MRVLFKSWLVDLGLGWHVRPDATREQSCLTHKTIETYYCSICWWEEIEGR